jgi:fatty-acyl-CoA synthase/long-chain acyl-CoA synthetase
MTTPDAHTLRAVFETSLEKYADHDAVTVKGRTLTYRELDRRANAVAHGLVERNVEPGDRVALMLSNCLEYIITDLAVIKAGAVKLPLNDMLAAEEFAYMLEDARAEALVAGPEFVDTAVDLAADLSNLDSVVGVSDGEPVPDAVERFEKLGGTATSPPDREVDSGDVAGHFYTGGTTGKPKGVVQTHESLTLNQYAHVTELGITGDETLLLMTPLPHSAGLFLWATLLTGAHAVVHPRFDPEDALDAITTHDVTWTFMVPTMIYRLLDHDDLAAIDTSSLSTLVYGAAPMTPARLREGLNEFGPIFLQFYGQTEIPNLITTLGKAEHARAIETGNEQRLSSAGHPCLMADVRAIDPETGEDVSIGEEGEILATAPYVMREYFERPDATAETVDDGWVHTGDVGKIDEDGYVYLLDRKSNMIITGGMNVYSTEVEEALDEHPEIREVAVVGVPHDDWGEAVIAVVVPRNADATSAEEVRTFANDQLADYKVPKEVEFVEEIPKTPFGKMDKKRLREPYWRDEERMIG